MKYELFKQQMTFYKALLEAKEDVEKEIDRLCYIYCGVKGIRYDLEKTSRSYSKDDKHILLNEALKEPEDELKKIEDAISKLEPVVYNDLDKLPDDVRLAAVMKFWKRKTYKEIGKIMGYTDNGIWHKIRREVEKI